MEAVTLQEKRILKLICEGYDTHKISHTIGICTHTLNSHIKNLLSKLDAKNYAELILNAVQEKLLRFHFLNKQRIKIQKK